MTYRSRRIFKSTNTSQSEIRELLQFIFTGEMLSPGKRVWLVMPWISDVPILDNRAGGFDVLDPGWGHRELRLIDVILRLLALRTEVVIVTRGDAHNKKFTDRLTEAASENGVDAALRIITRDVLHTKGVLTDTGFLSGSMNLTYNGLDLLDEMVTFDTSPPDVAQARVNFEGYIEAD